MQSAGDDSFSLTLASLLETINKQRFSLLFYIYYSDYCYYLSHLVEDFFCCSV